MGRKKNHPEHGKKKKNQPQVPKRQFLWEIRGKNHLRRWKEKKNHPERCEKKKKKKIASEPKFLTLPEI